MDVATVILSGVISAITTVCIMIVFYSRWILPYLTKLTNSIPAQVREFIEPYVNEKFVQIEGMVSDKVEDITKTVKTTSARFQRTVNQAIDFIGDDIDLSDDDQVEQARARVARRYGADVATSVISQLFNSITAKNSVKEAPKNDGWS